MSLIARSNPLILGTAIYHNLIDPALVTFQIYDILAREIDLLEPGSQPAGELMVNWNPKNIPSGIYIHKIYARDISDVGKTVFIK